MLRDSPEFEVLALHSAHHLCVFVVVDCLLWLRRRWLVVTALRATCSAWRTLEHPLLYQPDAYFFLQLEQHHLYWCLHVLLLYSFELRHALFDEFKDWLVLVDCLEASSEEWPERFFGLGQVDFIIFGVGGGVASWITSRQLATCSAALMLVVG